MQSVRRAGCSHWWNPETWALGPDGCMQETAYACPENPLGVKPREQRGTCSHRRGDPYLDGGDKGSGGSTQALLLNK